MRHRAVKTDARWIAAGMGSQPRKRHQRTRIGVAWQQYGLGQSAQSLQVPSPLCVTGLRAIELAGSHQLFDSLTV